jgi:hypothetical protein
MSSKRINMSATVDDAKTTIDNALAGKKRSETLTLKDLGLLDYFPSDEVNPDTPINGIIKLPGTTYCRECSVTPLGYLCSGSHIPIEPVKALLMNGADPNTTSPHAYFYKESGKKVFDPYQGQARPFPALDICINHGITELVALLLQFGAEYKSNLVTQLQTLVSPFHIYSSWGISTIEMQGRLTAIAYGAVEALTSRPPTQSFGFNQTAMLRVYLAHIYRLEMRPGTIPRTMQLMLGVDESITLPPSVQKEWQQALRYAYQQQLGEQRMAAIAALPSDRFDRFMRLLEADRPGASPIAFSPAAADLARRNVPASRFGVVGMIGDRETDAVIREALTARGPTFAAAAASAAAVGATARPA